MALAPGTRIDHFEVLSILGQGGMGTVYLAQDAMLHRTIALKVLHDEVTGTRERRQRFLREARLAASLDHPGVATVYEIGEAGDVVYIAMERVEGQSLRERIEASAPGGLGAKIAVDLGARIAEVLGAAHARGIVHRDLKPENVFVVRDDRVKLLDFGIAKAVAGDATAPEAGTTTELTTQAGLFLGTVAYVSPEQARGREVDARSDVFSLGVVLYEMLTGKRPFGGDSFSDIVASILRDEPVPPSKLDATIPASVDAVVLRCLSKEPADRYAEGEEVARVLAKGASGGPAAAAPARAGRRLSRIELASLGVAAVVVTAGVVTLIARSPSPGAPSGPSGAMSADARSIPTESDEAPPSTIPAAAAAYREGVLMFRDGRAAQSLAALERAIERDEGLAAAHLLMALSTFQSDPERGRKHFARAQAFRDRLGRRDRALLHVAEAFIRPNTDFALMEERAAEGLADFPDDPNLYYWQGIARQFRGDFEGAIRAYDALVTKDVGFARGWWLKAQALSNQGDLPGALDALDQCLTHSTTAVVCLQERAYQLRETGECEGMARDARAATTYEPELTSAYSLLASALASSGAPAESFEQVLNVRATKVVEADREEDELRLKARLAVHRGDFEGALASLRGLEERLADEPDLNAHAAVTAELAAVYAETDRIAEAGRVVDAFLARYQGLSAHPFGDAFRLTFHHYQLLAGSIDRARYVAIREEWLKGFEQMMKTRGSKTQWGMAWLYGYAMEVDSRADAEEALSVLPRFEPLPVNVRESAIRKAAMGRAYALAGRSREALPFLREAERACYALDGSWMELETKVRLGEVLEAEGDRDGARRLYEEVVAQWGQARPTSRTADRARARLRDLRL